MKPSSICFDLIKEFEGTGPIKDGKAYSYICPAGYATIWTGLTRYPDGSAVRLGDSLPIPQAQEYFQLEVNKFASQVLSLVSIPLSQSQFDSLVSFTFNVGINAFKNSTLLKKLNSKDYIGASNEFTRWVFASVNGKKTKLPGLVRRREKEKELFLKQNNNRDNVTWLQFSSINNIPYIIAWDGGNCLEAIQLPSFKKYFLSKIFPLYPNAQNIHPSISSSLPTQNITHYDNL